MPTLSDVDRALYALGYVKREFEFSGMADAYTKVTLDDGSSEEINVLDALAKAIVKMQQYEIKQQNEKELARQILEGVGTS